MRYLGLITILTFGVTSILGTGGDDDGASDETSIGLLSSYDFNIGRGIDSSGDETNGITASVPVNGSTALLRVDPNPVAGTFQCDTNS